MVRSGKMHFFLPDRTVDDGDDNDITIVYVKRPLPVSVLGVDLLMDFVMDGKTEDGHDVIIVTKNNKIEPFISVLS